jgi:hypothetical protein
MIQPNINERYYADGGENDIKSIMEDAYREALTINQSYWVEADIDARFKAGDQQIWSEMYGNPRISRQNFNFNRIRSIINMVTGHQRKERKSMAVIPIENSDQKTADQLSQVLFWATKRDNMLETISDAFEGAITCGMNLLSVWMDYRYDSVNGDVRVDNVGYNSYLIDPFFKKQNLSDCNYLWRRMWKSKNQLKGLFPGREDEIDNINPRGNRDGKFQYMPESYSTGNNNLISMDEFWYTSTRTQKIIEDVETGDTIEYFGDDVTLKSFLAESNNRIVKIIEVPSVQVCYCVDGRVFYNGENPYGHELRPIDSYPFVPVFAYYEPEIPHYPWRIQGMVRGLRDAQYLYNRRKVIELDIYESQVNSGWIYEEDALIDPTDVFMTGQGKGIGVKAGKLGAVQRIECPRIDPTMLQLSQNLAQEIMQISGVNEELLGSANDDKAGILSMLRQGAGLVTLQKLFDQLDYSQKILGGIIIEMIQANFRKGKIERITGDEASPQFKEKAFQRFDIEISSGINTDTQKQMQFIQMWELAQGGIPIAPEDLLEASTIQNKSEIIENMQKRQAEQAKQAQEQQAVQIEVLKAQINSINSKALSDNSLGLERISRVSENEALSELRHSQAIENIQDAQLSKARTIKELANMDLDQIVKMLGITTQLKEDTLDDAKESGIEKSGTQDKVEALQMLKTTAEQTML